jgi:hypothetical protein
MANPYMFRQKSAVIREFKNNKCMVLMYATQGDRNCNA